MIIIKVYNKSYVKLTSFIQGQYTDLSYRSVLHETGEASFSLNMDKPNVTVANLNHYNFVEIEDDGVVKWVGVILDKDIDLNLVAVKCVEIPVKLSDRVVTGAYSGAFDVQVASLLSTLNSAEPTGIVAVVTNITTSVTFDFKKTNALSAIQQMVDRVGAQWVIEPTDRTLYIYSTIGVDLTGSVELRYDSRSPKLATLLKFKVKDSGRNIVTKTYATGAGVLTSTQTDVALQGQYALVEDSKAFSQANAQPDLDNLASNNNRGAQYSPALELKPTIPDNFYIGDLVKIKLKNKLLNVEQNYQILEKSVTIISSKEKSITVRVNELPNDFFKDFKNLNQRVKSLENN